jgi:hypothetical protein
MRDAQLKGLPARFTYPERGIDFSLYIQNMNEIGLDGEQGEITVYTITSVITEDHTALSKSDQSGLINLPENIGWIDVENAARLAAERFRGGGTGQDGGRTEVDEEEDEEPEREPVRVPQ